MLQCFEHGNAVEIRNGIMFDFYPGLAHVSFKFRLNHIPFNPLTTDDAFWCCLTFGCMLSVGAISFEDRFCTSIKGGMGEVGGCTPLDDSASIKGGIGGGGWVHPSG